MLADHFPPEIEAEFGPQLDALASAGYQVTDVDYKGPPNGDWLVRLEGPRPLWLTKEDGQYAVEGPRQELEAAGLWQPLDRIDEFWHRLQAFAIGDDVRRSAPPLLPLPNTGGDGATTAHPGNPAGKKVVSIIIMASIATTLAVNGITWSTNGVDGLPADFVRFVLWTLIWVGLHRGSRGARIAALVFFSLGSLSLLFLFAAPGINLTVAAFAAFGLVHLVSVIVLLKSEPVLEHFAFRR